MATPKSGLPDRQKPVSPPVVVKLTVAVGSTGGIAAAIYLAFAEHVPFSSRAGVFEDLMAVIVLVAVATITLTVLVDHMARSHLRYQAGKKAVDTAQSNDQALQTYRTLNSSLSWRWLRWLLGLPSGPDEDGKGQGQGGLAAI